VSNFEQTRGTAIAYADKRMAAARSLLCIHRDPAQLSLLQKRGYEVLTATHGSQGLRLLVSKPVDAVILEHDLGLLDGAAIADEIKKVRPRLPIVMLAESLELPEGALKSVDALVTKGDGPSFLLEAIHSVLQTKDRLYYEADFAGPAAPLEAPMLAAAKGQILVVDDDQSVCEILAMS